MNYKKICHSRPTPKLASRRLRAFAGVKAGIQKTSVLHRDHNRYIYPGMLCPYNPKFNSQLFKVPVSPGTQSTTTNFQVPLADNPANWRSRGVFCKL